MSDVTATFSCVECSRRFEGDRVAAHAHFTTHTEQLTPQGWERGALAAIKAAAATGRTFTIAAVLQPLGPHPDSDRAQFINGALTRRLAAAGVIEAVGATESIKPDTHASLVKTWRGTNRKAA